MVTIFRFYRVTLLLLAGLDQLEVLSDSGGSLSPDSDNANTVVDSPDMDVGSMVEIVIRGQPR